MKIQIKIDGEWFPIEENQMIELTNGKWTLPRDVQDIRLVKDEPKIEEIKTLANEKGGDLATVHNTTGIRLKLNEIIRFINRREE